MYYRASRRSRCMILACAAAIAVQACGGAKTSETAETTALVCSTPNDSVVGLALEKFITTRPIASVRYLHPALTDSAVPEAAQWPMQDKGRVMYLYPPDPAMQVKQRDQLRAMGRSPLLVVSYHGMGDEPDGRKSVVFSGRYLDVANEGKTIPHTKIFFDCQAADENRFVASDTTPTPAM